MFVCFIGNTLTVLLVERKGLVGSDWDRSRTDFCLREGSKTHTTLQKHLKTPKFEGRRTLRKQFQTKRIVKFRSE